MQVKYLSSQVTLSCKVKYLLTSSIIMSQVGVKPYARQEPINCQVSSPRVMINNHDYESCLRIITFIHVMSCQGGFTRIPFQV
jgi:hypothetical protein